MEARPQAKNVQFLGEFFGDCMVVGSDVQLIRRTTGGRPAGDRRAVGAATFGSKAARGGKEGHKAPSVFGVSSLYKLSQHAFGQKPGEFLVLHGHHNGSKPSKTIKTGSQKH